MNMNEVIEEVSKLSKELINIKKQMVIKNGNKYGGSESDISTMAKVSIFEVPLQFWQTGFDTFYFKDYPYASIKFTDFAKNRENFEYVKEFNRLNSYQPHYVLRNSVTGDLFQVNKGFVMGMTDDDSSDSMSEENKYSFLAESEFSAEGIDFSDPGALLKRQKAILEAIHKHQNNEKFDPLRVLTRGINTWILILCHGGKFFL